MAFNLYSDDQNAKIVNPQGGQTSAQEGLLQTLLDEEQTGILIRARKGVEEIAVSQENQNGRIARTIFSPKFNKSIGIRFDLTPTLNI